MFTPNERLILDSLRQRVPLDLAEVAAQSGLARSSAHLGLQGLVANGLVESWKQGGRAVYALAARDQLERAAQRIVSEFMTAVLPAESTAGKPRLVFTDSYVLPDPQLKELRKHYEVVTFDDRYGFIEQELFVSRCRNAEVIVHFDFCRIDREFLQTASHLKAIVLPTCFSMGIDYKACEDFGVAIWRPDPIAQKYFATAQLEYALHAVLTLLNPLRKAPSVLHYDWRNNLVEDLFGKKIGLIAAQSNLRTFVEIFSAFGCEVRAGNTEPSPPLAADAGLSGYYDVEELWAWSDIVIALDGATFDVDPLLAIEGERYFVAMSASLTMDVDVLPNALASGRLRGLAIDIPPFHWWTKYTDHELETRLAEFNNATNVFVTPEMGTFSKASMERSYAQVFKALTDLAAKFQQVGSESPAVPKRTSA